ncbi:MAG: DNA/RNA nuclease SfsA [Candidatus Odinarchaeota archaeon]
MKSHFKIPISDNTLLATFLDRPNRFLVRLVPDDSDRVEEAFLHDPGRLLELLEPGVELLIRRPVPVKGRKAERKTNWDVLAVRQNGNWIIINSSFPNRIARIAIVNGWLPELAGYTTVKSEYPFGHSRLDFLLSREKHPSCLVEVKGVTLAKGEKALFPDAPTARGARHLEELIRSVQEGYRAVVLFLVMRDEPVTFSPNADIDPLFTRRLISAAKCGVEILVYKVQPVLEDHLLSVYLRNPLVTGFS